MNSSTTSQQRIPDATAAEQRAHEPSMEEILASIRRIIADDQMLPISRPAAREAPPAEAPTPSVAEARAPVAPAPRVEPVPVAAPVATRAEPVVEIQRPIVREAPRVEPPVQEPPRSYQRPEAPRQETPRQEIPRPQVARQEPPRREPTPTAKQDVAGLDTAPLLSPAIGSSVSSAFNALATSMILQNQGMVEEATREMLRPMLKQWLDDNLPIIVERLVRLEIERVARGGR